METEVVGSNRNIIRDCNDDASTSKTRRNLDKRSARLVHGRSFAAEIARLVSSNEYQSSGATSKSDTLSAEIGQAAMRGGSPINEGGKVTVAIRKRPLFPAEASRGDFNVVTMGEGACTVFKTALQADMKTAVIVPFTYPCTAALDEATTNPEVYRKVLQPHVVAAASAGNGSFPPPSMMLFTFGMTGSGKSHTMTGLERELVDDVPYPVSVQFLEVSGKVCRDLLAPEGTSAVASAADHAEVTGNRAWSPVRERSPIRILDQGDLSVLGATWVVTNTPDQLLDLLASAKTRRATHATDRNHESSRSHALVTLRLGSTGACLTLVDCAGTERSHDSLYHCKDRRAESAEINSSLYALKECIRARAAVAASASVPPLHKKPLLIPYRSSMLTRILRPHLESGGPLAVIATISPSATDTEHTLQTLDAVSMLLGTSGHVGSSHKLTQPRIRPESSDANHSLTVAPKKWTHEQLVNFLHRKHVLRSPRPADGSSASGSSIARSRLPAVVVPSTLDGRHAMRMNKIQLANTLGVPREVADRIFDLLRAETTRVARLELKQRVQAKNVSSLM
jgi:kinesin family protein 2/24